MAVSYSISNITTSSFKVSVTGTNTGAYRYIRVFVRTTGGTTVYDNKWLDSRGVNLTATVSGLSPGTTYVVNVAYNSTASADGSTWVGGDTVTTDTAPSEVTYWYAFRYENSSGTRISTTAPMSVKDNEGGTIIYTSEAEDYKPSGYVITGYGVYSGAATYRGGQSWTVTSTSYSNCAVLLVKCVSTSATYYYAFRYHDENGNWLKTTGIYKETNSSGGVVLTTSDADAYLPSGYEASSYSTYSGAITYVSANKNWVVSSMSEANPGIALVICKKKPTYNYYIYWSDLLYSKSQPWRTSSATGVTSSTYSFTAPTPSRTGYTFEGWCASYSGNNGTGSIVVGGGESINLPYANQRSITLYARWTQHIYNIYFNAGGGSGSMDSLLNCYYITSYTLPKNTYTKAQTITYNYNYTGGPSATNSTVYRSFSYWSCTNGNTYADQATVQGLTPTNGGSVTMTAQWGNYSHTLLSPSRDGYAFDGWYNAATGGNLVGKGGATLSGTTNRTLYAHWTASVRKPTLTYSSHTDTSITVILGRNSATSGTWRIEISTNSSFSNIVGTRTLSYSDSTTIVFSGLSPNTTYYIKATHIVGNATSVSDTLIASTRISDFAWTSDDAVMVVAGQVVSDAITAAKWIELGEKINWCLSKKGYATTSFTSVQTGNTLTAAIFNALRNAMAKMDSSVTGEVSSGSEVKAAYFANNSASLKSVINSIISKL